MSTHLLEKRIAPPLVTLAYAALMWLLAKIPPVVPLAISLRLILAIGLALLGAGLALAAVVTFRRARTTVNPYAPESTSTLVVSGVYRLTRNPIYLGFLLLLTAWAVWLAAPMAVLGLLLFVPYISRFQIRPEERVLSQLFGTSYTDYLTRVRRWI